MEQETAPSSIAESIAVLDPATNDGTFSLKLLPLTATELEEAVKLWSDKSQNKTREVSDLNIAVNSSDESDVKALREKLVTQLTRRTLLFSKLNMLLKEWEAKGAKPEQLKVYRDYIAAVRRSELQTNDLNTLINRAMKWFWAADGGRKVLFWCAGLIGTIILVLFLTKFLTRLVRRGLTKIPEMSDLLRNFISKVVYWIILAIGLILGLSLFGINMTPLLAVFGGASFIIGFAMQSTLGNLASGLLLMITKPFDVGDVVDAAGVSGTVRNVSIVSTTIITFDNQVIVVPNTMVWDSVITNVNRSDTRRVDLVFGIGYDDDIELAKSTLADIIANHPLVLDDPAPLIKLHELADSSVNFICRPWAKSEDYWTVYWDVMQQAKVKFDEVGLSIPYPQQDVHLHQIGNSTDDANRSQG